MTPEDFGIACSLAGLTFVLGFLTARGFRAAYRARDWHRLVWPAGLSMATAATLIELLAFVGVVTVLLLQAYVFFSAAIVGVLALGALRAFHQPAWNRLYVGYTGVALGVLGVVAFSTPLPLSMVVSGVISGNPTDMLLALSILVTVPATVLLLTASVLSLRRAFRWKSVMILVGAIVLGAGGFLYIASFPVMLYYAEFIGVFLLFLGLVDFSGWTAAARREAPLGRKESA